MPNELFKAYPLYKLNVFEGLNAAANLLYLPLHQPPNHALKFALIGTC